MRRRKGPRRLDEYEVKQYFQLLTEEARDLQQAFEALSNEPPIPSMQRVVLDLEYHYRDICYPGARGTEARLKNLDNISQTLDAIFLRLGDLKKSVRKFRTKVMNQRTREIAEKLWYN